MDGLGAGDPQQIGAYRLLARLGAGGMGQVYLARSQRGRTVAVKLVREELAAQEEFRARFRQEVQAARQVGGHWTAPVLDADTEAAVPWVATGYVAGPSLQQVVGHDHGALPERSVRILGAGLAHALKDIHAAGIVHRDLKPSNVLVTIDGPRVIDFGIARALETVTDGGLTHTGALVGSPGFMAPEQVRGDRITPACDVFCLGSVLAYAATGRLPFGTESSGVHALMFRIAQEEPDLTGVPEGIADLVRDCLRKDPAARPGLDRILARTGADDTVSGGRSRDPWLPSALVAQLGRHAVRLLDTEGPGGTETGAGAGRATGGPAAASAGTPGAASAGGPVGGAAANPAGGVVGGPAASPAGRPEGSPAGSPPASPAGSPAGRSAAGSVGGPAVGAAGRSGAGSAESPGAGSAGRPAGTPEHAAVGDAVPGEGPPAPGEPGVGGGLDHLPTMVTGQGAPPPTAPPGRGFGAAPTHPAYGYPQPPQSPPPPQSPYGSTPPYGPPTMPYYGPVAPPEEPHRRSGRSTALLVVVALVVALGAGGSVYALMSGGEQEEAGGGATASPTVSAPVAPAPDPTSEPPAPTESASASAADVGTVPSAFLGTWFTTIDNAAGHHTRELTLQQGEVGDTVLSLVADGPAYHCVFTARLDDVLSAGGPLEIGPSSVTVGEPATSCTPGEATRLTLLGDGTLKRVNISSGESLTYTRG
ncbi:serine/threonine-protein kinase [Streptomyces sp. TRM68416]|uniref:serine/threonine-protein kinase n=1 Tax=Streptomyces sp. TRM68416 TaxID=2758412 RepID=UPI001661AEDD|nr:serine/threonine-protein kinase [Streptomyces sp. TRM68416]MBD0838704.1 protein kinase [Streptomyces sp. TRM68416]